MRDALDSIKVGKGRFATPSFGCAKAKSFSEKAVYGGDKLAYQDKLGSVLY